MLISNFIILLLLRRFISFRHASHGLSFRQLPIFMKSDTLSFERIASSWRVVQYGQSTGIYGLECTDKTLDVASFSVDVSRQGGLGLDLMELYRVLGSNLGLVVVDEILQNSNAAKTGKFQTGDTLISISGKSNDPNQTPKYSKLEGLNFDATISEISKFSEYDTISLVVRRLQARAKITVQAYDPKGTYLGNFTVLSGYGSNLRIGLLTNDFKLYDERTNRFDAPYQTGDCGGEGTCGTCMVAVLSGNEYLNDRQSIEDRALKKGLYPPNYRWSCRTKISPGSGSSRSGTNFDDTPPKDGVVKIKLRPQTAKW